MTIVRAVGIATHSPSHIDFGGNGFIRLMDTLRARGHDVQWVSCGRTAARLTELGWQTREAPELRAARRATLWPMSTASSTRAGG